MNGRSVNQVIKEEAPDLKTSNRKKCVDLIEVDDKYIEFFDKSDYDSLSSAEPFLKKFPEVHKIFYGHIYSYWLNNSPMSSLPPELKLD